MFNGGDKMAIYWKEIEGKTKKSKEIFEKSKELLPLGVSSNYRYLDPYPIYFSKGKGTRIYDADGNEYLDFNMAFGVLSTGHSHPKLVEAIKERIENGTILGFEYERVHEAARLIKEIYGMDMVRFSTTGGEATQAAVRLARGFTGRPKILKFEGCYHGSHDSLLVSIKPDGKRAGYSRDPIPLASSWGVNDSFVRDVFVAPFNDIEAVTDIFEKHHNEIAGVILEPVPMNMGLVLPEKGFLEGLRKITEEYGSVLIFDEIKTGVKYYGGASRYFGVKPDIITLGKSIGGGYPISAVAGRKEIMSLIAPGKISHAGTFNSNPLSIDAAITVLRDILTENNYKKAENLSMEIYKGYSDIIEDLKLPLGVSNWALSGQVYFGLNKVRNWRDFLKTNVSQWYEFLILMMKNGVVPAAPGPDEQWTVSVQHNKEEVEINVETFKKIAPLIKNITSEMAIEEAI